MASQFQFEAIGTHWRIIIDDVLAPARESALIEAIRDRITIFDQDYSRFRDDSLVSAMSQNAGVYTLPSDSKELFSLYRELYMITGGLFTPLIGRMLSDAGYDAQYSLVSKPLNPVEEWDEAMEYQYPKLTIKKPVLIDIGAAGKGYLVDIVSDLIASVGAQSFVVDAGGDIYAKTLDAKTIRVALEHPDNQAQAIGVAHISNQSICGSAGNRRAWGEFHHIMNPKTFSSPKHLKAVWVTAQSALIADALATCLFFIHPSSLMPRFAFEYLVMNADNTVERSPGFIAELFTS